MFRKPTRKELYYFVVILLLYVDALTYVYQNNLSFGATFKNGLLQEKGVQGDQARIVDIETPLTWNIP